MRKFLFSTYDNGLRIGRQVHGRQRRSVESLLLQLGIVLASLSTVSVARFVFAEDSPVGLWLWISPAILFVACAGTAYRIIRTDTQMVASPVFWVLLASGVYFGFGPLIYSFGNRSTIELMDGGFAIGSPELFLTNMLNSIGMLAVVVGLAVGRRLVGARPHGWVQFFEGMNGLRVAGVLAAVGLTAKFTVGLPIVFGLIGTQSSTLLQMQMLSKAALIILSYLSVTKGGKATAWFVLLFMIEILTAGLVNSKMVILEVIIAALVGRTLALRRTSTLVKGFVILGLLQLILQPVVSNYRSMSDRSTMGNYATSLVVAGKLMVRSFSDLMHGTNDAQEATPQGWWARLCYTPQQAFAMQEYDSGRSGSPWKDFRLALVPRVFWPDKPLVTPGVNFSVLFDSNPLNNNAPSVLGEGYWYGGWLGLLAVGLYTGVFLGGMDRISTEVISRRAWILMPLVFIGIKSGFRIDGLFSTEFMFGSVWYVLFAVSMFYSSAFYLTMIRGGAGHKRRRAWSD